jgi:hypothetical protein
MNLYRASTKFETLNTSKTARLRRAESAIRATVGQPMPIDNLRATNQASASMCTVRGIELLISYTTVAAYRLPSGQIVATERGEFSRTTDRSVDAFGKPHARHWQPEFEASLRRALAV